MGSSCSVTGCAKPAIARSWCTTHYQRWKFTGDPTYSPKFDREQIRSRRIAFFWANVDTSAGPDGCWPWQRKLTAGGYGQMRGFTGQTTSYRFAYELLVGPVPPGKELDHECHNRDKERCGGGASCPHRACCNPYHLEPVLPRENKSRGIIARPNNGGRLPLRERPRCGHEYTVRKSGHRYCRTCYLDSRRRNGYQVPG